MSLETFEVIGMGCFAIIVVTLAMLPVWLLLTRRDRTPRPRPRH